MSDDIKSAIPGIVINIIIAVVTWSLIIWQTKRTIQATLQAAQPKVTPKRTKKRKVLGHQQRRIIKFLHLMVFLSVTALVNSGLSVRMAILFPMPPERRWVDVLSFVSIALSSSGMFWVLITALIDLRLVRAGDRKTINKWKGLLDAVQNQPRPALLNWIRTKVKKLFAKPEV